MTTYTPRGGVAGLLGRLAPKARAAASPRDPAPVIASSAGRRQPDSAAAAEVRAEFGVIDLSAIREGLGPQWASAERRARTAAEGIIARHLLRGDVFEAQEDGTYLVLFAAMSKAQAEFKCRVISKEITEKVLGSDAVQPVADTAPAPPEKLEATLSFGDLDALAVLPASEAQSRKASEEAFAAEPEGADPAGPPPSGEAIEPALMIGEPWRERVEDQDEIWKDIAPGEMAGLREVWKDVRVVRPKRSSSTTASAHVPRKARRDLWRYTPVWDFEQMSLVRFRLSSRELRPGRAGAAASAGDIEARSFEADLRTVAKGLDDLSKLSAEGRRLLVICVVHISSLSVAWRRDQLVELVAHASPRVRQMLSIEVFTPEFSPTEALARFAEALNALGVEVSVAAPLANPTPIRPAGMTLSLASAEVREDSLEAIQMLKTFSRRCAQVEIGSAAHGLNSRALVIAAMAAGIRFLSGAAIHEPTDDLGRGLRFEPLDLYRSLLASRAG